MRRRERSGRYIRILNVGSERWRIRREQDYVKKKWESMTQDRYSD